MKGKCLNFNYIFVVNHILILQSEQKRAELLVAKQCVPNLLFCVCMCIFDNELV